MIKHYHEDGSPTTAHIRMTERSERVAEKAVQEGYISTVEISYNIGDDGKWTDFKVCLCGKPSKRKGKKRILPGIADHMSDRNAELIDFIADEISIYVAHRYLGSDKVMVKDISVKRIPDSLVIRFAANGEKVR